MSTTRFPPFDPSRLRIVSHRMSTTQGSFTILLDGKEAATYDDPIVRRSEDGVVTYDGMPGYKKSEVARRLWERGDARAGIRPLSGGDPYITADSEDVIVLTTRDRETWLCHVDYVSPTGKASLAFYRPMEPGVANAFHRTRVDVTEATKQPEALRAAFGKLEWDAAVRFAAWLQSRDLLDRAERQWHLPISAEARKVEKLRLRCAALACEVQSLIDYMDVRDTDILVNAAYQYAPEQPEGRDLLALPLGPEAFRVYENAWSEVVSTRWSAEPAGPVLTPRWMGSFNTQADQERPRTWVEPYTYVPAVDRDRMSDAPSEWILRMPKQACVDRHGHVIRPDNITKAEAPNPRG